jgi:hypothetical protein
LCTRQQGNGFLVEEHIAISLFFKSKCRLEWNAIVVTATPIRLLVLFGFSLVVCSAQVPPEKTPRLAVEIQGNKGMPPTYAMVGDGDGVSSSWFYGQNLRHLPSSDSDTRKPSVLKLEFKAAAGVVSISATAYYGAFDEQHWAASAEKLAQENVGTYSGRLNDSVALTGLEQVGLEPVTLRIVSAQSEQTYTPLTRSDAPSLQIDFAPLDRVVGMVTVHNLSSKAVVALRIGGSENGSGWAQGEESGGQTPLIAPGARYDAHVTPGSSGRIVDGTYVADPPSAELVLQAVLFADGSFEGDMQIAAEMAARRIGESLQRRRIAALAAPILADTELDDPARVKRILAAADRLSTEPDAQMAVALRANFPGLTDKELAVAQLNFSEGMENEKQSLAIMLKQFDPDFNPAAFWNAVCKCN